MGQSPSQPTFTSCIEKAECRLATVSAEHSFSFQQLASEIYYGLYHLNRMWYICKIHSIQDNEDCCTIMWEDGSLQPCARITDLRRPALFQREIKRAVAAAHILPEQPAEIDKGQVLSLIPTTELFLDIAADQHDPLFAAHSSSPILYGCYRHDSSWHICRIRSFDVDGTLTIVWEDGSLQIGSTVQELQRPVSPNLLRDLIAAVSKAKVIRKTHLEVETPPQGCDVRLMVPTTHNGMTVWEAAKKGDMETLLHLVDHEGVSPNQEEILGVKDERGRSPLYWACFVGHVEMVRELLLRGGVDADGSAYLAVTSKEKANDNRDILFDPDTGTYSDWVDYKDAEQKQSNHGDTALIRAMLLTAKSAPSHSSMRHRLPQRLYQSTDKRLTDSDCIICLNSKADAIPVPCAHIAACASCLRKVRKKCNECPICRERIVSIVLL